MLLLDSEAISALGHGPAACRDRVRALIAAMHARSKPIATVAAVLAEVVRGRPADAGVRKRASAAQGARVDLVSAVGAAEAALGPFLDAS